MLGSAGFAPAWNVAASRIRETSASLRNLSSFDLDPNGFGVLTDLRVEASAGDRDDGRAALDVTLSHPLERALSRDFSGALTVSGGSSTGVGIGLSFLDGLIRADVARGSYPEKSWRRALYREATF